MATSNPLCTAMIKCGAYRTLVVVQADTTLDALTPIILFAPLAPPLRCRKLAMPNAVVSHVIGHVGNNTTAYLRPIDVVHLQHAHRDVAAEGKVAEGLIFQVAVQPPSSHNRQIQSANNGQYHFLPRILGQYDDRSRSITSTLPIPEL